MIDAWHLLWLLPAAAFFGFSLGAWLATGKEADQPGDSTLARDDYCTECPFNPKGDDIHD